MFSFGKNTYQLVFIICFFIVFSALITISVTVYSIHKTAYEGSKELVLAQAKNVSDSLELVLNESVAAARAIVLSPVFIEILENEDKYTQDEVVERFRRYLKNFDRHFQYSTISIVSDKTKKYYTNLGFNKVMDLENDPHDIWYKLFLDLNTTFDFDMDFDEPNDNKWTLFTNVRINNANGQLLGVSGFGRDLAYLRELLTKLEKEHRLKIYFIDDKGNIVLGADTSNIKNRLLSKEKRKESEYFKLDEINGRFVVTRYIDQIGWTLAVEKKQNIAEVLFGLIKLNLATTLIILAVIVSLSSILIHRRQKHLLNLSQKDGLTGILNRKSGEEQIALKLKNNIGGMFCLLDADKFKDINDTYGHGAGDEVIKKIADALSKISRDGDIAFRLGGDEFGFFAQDISDKKLANEIIQRLFTELNEQRLSQIENKEIQISVGVTFLLLGDSFERAYERADKALYESKKIDGRSIFIAG